MTPAEFRAIRKSLGLTQAQLAPLLGLGANTRVSEIERGAEVSVATARLMDCYASGYRPPDWPRPAPEGGEIAGE